MKEATSRQTIERSDKNKLRKKWEVLYDIFEFSISKKIKIMSNSDITTSLEKLTRNLLDETVTEIRSHREQISPIMEIRFYIAEHLLLEAMEYTAGAFEMIKSGKANASIAVSRWILEASLNLLWAVADKNKVDERLRDLCGETLRDEANYQEGLATLFPDKASIYKANATRARKVRDNLNVEELKGLCTRLEEVQKQLETSKLSYLYPLYRICCASAHPSLKIWERFGCGNDPTFSKIPPDKKSTACWIATASVYYLVVHTYCLTELGDSKYLKDWWTNKVEPLLKMSR